MAYYEGSDRYAYYPSFALRVAAASLNLQPSDFKVTLGTSAKLGNLTIGTDDRMRMLTFFYGDGAGGSAFKSDSFFDGPTGAIKLDKYRDKVVLLGPTASGLSDFFTTPVQSQASPLELLAHVVSSILQEHFFTQPVWAGYETLAAIVLIAIYLLVLLPRLGAGAAAGLTIALALVLMGAELGLLIAQATWVELVIPTFMLVVGHAILTTKRFLVSEQDRAVTDMESA